MLRVTYTGGETTQRWLFDPDAIEFDEAERIEEAMGPGETWDSFVAGLLDRKVRVRRILLWHLLRRTNPDYPMPLAETPNAKMGQLTVELGTAELTKMAAQIEDAPITQARKAKALSTINAEFALALAAEAEIEAADVTAEPDPKDGPADGMSHAGAGQDLSTDPGARFAASA